MIVKQHQDYLRDYAVQLEKQVSLRTRQIESSREQIIQCLARAAEYRDNETEWHVLRVGKYSAVIAKQLDSAPITVGKLNWHAVARRRQNRNPVFKWSNPGNSVAKNSKS